MGTGFGLSKEEIEKMKIISDEWKKRETVMNSDIERLRRESENWKKEEMKLRDMISHMEVSGSDEDKKHHSEIIKVAIKKFLVALLKENPNLVKKNSE
jgi:predicted  nucleic acid-binding Zn-ribbon protein